jgi:hypothetical protein
MPMISRRSLLVATAATLGASALARVASAQALTPFRPTGSGRVDHSAFDAMLQRYVKPDGQNYNRVDYRAFRAQGSQALKAYLAQMSAVDPVRLSRSEAHAYWINLYNAKTIEVILDHYPVRSIRDIRLGGGGLFKTGPWSKPLLTVAGVNLSLDDIEHRIVLALFADPMSHYGLNCASYSCPNLATRAYTGDTIERMLVESATDYVNHSRGVSIERDRITASRIYSWYAKDFGGEAGLKPHWKRFAAPQLSAAIDAASIGGYEYDWSLNDV